MKRGINLACSEHAKQRIKERIGIEDKRKIKELTKAAYHSGLSMKKHYIPKNTLKWIDRKVNNNYYGRCSQWRIYGEHLFLFSKTLTLVTVIEIPKNLQIKKDKKSLERW